MTRGAARKTLKRAEVNAADKEAGIVVNTDGTAH